MGKTEDELDAKIKAGQETFSNRKLDTEVLGDTSIPAGIPAPSEDLGPANVPTAGKGQGYSNGPASADPFSGFPAAEPPQPPPGEIPQAPQQDPFAQFPDAAPTQATLGGTAELGRPKKKLPPLQEVPLQKVDLNDVVNNARTWIGKTYAAGQKEKCAEFQRMLFKKYGINLPVSQHPVDYDQGGKNYIGENYANSLSGTDVGPTVKDLSKLQKGDLVFYQNTYGDWEEGAVTHVGMATGNGMVLHRSSDGTVLEVPQDSIGKIRSATRPDISKKQKFTGSPSDIVDGVLGNSGMDIHDQSVMRRMFHQESGMNPKAVSSAGALGIGQMMPGTAAPYLNKLGYSQDDYLKNPQVQAFVSTEHMKDLLKKYDGNWARALAAYNGGSGAVDTAIKNGGWKPSDSPDSYFVQTRNYVADILNVSPEQAEQLVVKGLGQKANLLPPPVQQAQDQKAHKAGVKGWLGRLLTPSQQTAQTPPPAPPSDQIGAGVSVPQKMIRNEDAGNPVSDIWNRTQNKMDRPSGYPFSEVASDIVMDAAAPFTMGAPRALQQSRQLDQERGQTANLFKDVQEGVKAMMRGFTSGVLDLQNYAEKNTAMRVANVMVNPTGFVSEINRPFLPSITPGLLQMMAPDAEYFAPVNAQIAADYRAEGIDKDNAGFHGWVANTARWMVPPPVKWALGMEKEKRTPMLNRADLEAFSMEIPTFAGMVMSAEMLGPEVGLLGRAELSGVKRELAMPGSILRGEIAPRVADFTEKMFKTRFPALSKTLSTELFEKSAIWGAVGASQMASQGMADEINSNPNATIDSIASAGLLNGMLGYAMGMAFPLAMPTLTEAAGSTFSHALGEASKVYRDAPWRPGMQKSIVDWFGKVDPNGWFRARLIKNQILTDNLTAGAIADANRSRTGKNLGKVAEGHDLVSTEYQAALQERIDNVDKLQQQITPLQAMADAFEVQHPHLAASAQNANPLTIGTAAQAVRKLQNESLFWKEAEAAYLTAQQAQGIGSLQQWQSQYGVALKLEKSSEFPKAMRTRGKAIQSEIETTIQAAGVDDPIVMEQYLKIKDRVTEATQQLQQAQADPIYQNRDGYGSDSIVYESQKEYIKTWQEHVESGGYMPEDWAGPSTAPVELPTGIQQLGAVMSEESEIIIQNLSGDMQALVDRGMVLGGNIEGHARMVLTRASRAMAESAQPGTRARMSEFISTTEVELKALEANPPKPLKSEPSSRSHDAVDLPAAKEDWERNVKPQHQQAMKEHADRVQVLKNRLKRAQKASDSIYGTELATPDQGVKRIVDTQSGVVLERYESELKQAGFSGGMEQLNRLTDYKEVPTSTVEGELRRQRKDQTQQKVDAARQAVRSKPAAKYSAVNAAGKAEREAERKFRNEVIERGKNNGGYTQVEVPVEWIAGDPVPGPAEVAAAKPLATKDRIRKKPIFLGELDADGKFQIVDGQKRVTLSRQEGGTVKALVPVDLWDTALANKTAGLSFVPLFSSSATQFARSGTHFTLGAPGPVLPHIQNQALAEAEQWLRNMGPAQRQGLLQDEVGRALEMFHNSETPSRLRLQQVQGMMNTPWQAKQGTALQASFAVNREMAETFQQAAAGRMPSSLTEMWVKGMNRAKRFVHDAQLGRKIAEHVAGDFQPKYEAARAEAVKLMPGPETEALKIKNLETDMADALQQMPETTKPLENFLRKYPQMGDSLATYFDTLRMLEEWKVSSPHLKSYFSQVGFAHIFPRMRVISAAGSMDGKESLIMTKLFSEQKKKWPTLADARKAYLDATNELRNAPGWGAKPPATPLKMEDRFIRASPSERMRILGDEATADDAQHVLLRLGLRDPITNPTDLIRGQIHSMMVADATRSFLSDLATIPIPGMQDLHPETGKPYTILGHYPTVERKGPNGEVTQEIVGAPGHVPSFTGGIHETSLTEGPRSKSMMQLGSEQFGFDKHATVELNGKEVPVSELYIHPDIGDALIKRILTGREGKGAWADMNEVIRMGALIGSPVPHLLNVAADHWGALAGHALGVLIDDVFPNSGLGVKPKIKAPKVGFNPMGVFTGEGATALLNSPRDAIGMFQMGNEARLSVMLQADGAQHGLSMQTWDAWSRMAAQEAVAFIKQEAGDLFDQDEMTPFESFMSDVVEKHGDFPTAAKVNINRLGEARDQSTIFKEPQESWAQGMQADGQAAVTLSKAGLNMIANSDYFLNKMGLFEPIRQAQLAAYAHWTAVHWKDMGQKMVDNGVPKLQALKICKEEAANYVNLISGLAPHYKDVKNVRQLAYGHPELGPLSLGFSALTPGWLRAKVHGMLSVVDPLIDLQLGGGKPIAAVMEKFGWDRRTMGATSQIENPMFREYVRKQWARHFVMQVAGGWAGLNMLNMLCNGGANVVQLNPDNPKKWLGVRLGDRDYSWPLFGMFKDTVRMLKGSMTGDIPDMVKWFSDQLNTPARTMMQLGMNRDDRGNDIVSPDRSLGAIPDKAVDISKFILSKTTNPEDTLGISAQPGQFGEQKGISSKGIPDWYASLLGVHGQPYNQPASEKAYMEALEEFPRRKVAEHTRLDIERYFRDGDREAFVRAMEYAMNPKDGNGYALSGDTKTRMGEDYYRMSPERFEEMVMKTAAPMGYALSKLDDQEKLWLYPRLKRYRDAQAEYTVPYSLKRRQAEKNQ